MRAMPSSCPPDLPTPETHTNTHRQAAFQTPRQRWNSGQGAGVTGAPGSVPHHSQDLLNYKMEFVQVVLRPQSPPPTTPRKPALSLKSTGEGGLSQKPVNGSRALKAQNTKRVKLREILFLPVNHPPHSAGGLLSSCGTACYLSFWLETRESN